jgi:hypothetical protein
MQRVFYTLCVLLFLSFGNAKIRAGNHANDIHHDNSYGEVLKLYVDDKGMVDYKSLKTDRAKLDHFSKTIEGISEQRYGLQSKNDKIAFWMNVYNAMTLKAIIDNYPIKSSALISLKFPKNSIRQISKVWKKKNISVLGKKLSLSDIENKILRKEFDEPRIHVALVCAAVGCPPLRVAQPVPTAPAN